MEGNVNAFQNIIEWMKKPSNILIFNGSPGIGKTYFCAALTEWALSKFNTVRYHKEENLLRALRLGISEGRGDYLTTLELMTDSELVILDDVGSGINADRDTNRDLEFRREVFFSFLDKRYNSELPTIITSNFSKKDFEKVYSQRITSRLFASENTIISIFDEESDKRKQGY